ncbi:L,D-transpeptidase family protein [Azospirillum soli]|uniref:L,D-transpeptidase family protein n=1 Tax=Azospirillum soli TaxID=1304799 RepID=UPI001AE49357|nr:L,D-transpeptidase family protein [Azospirillum soli]MBP2311583.1 L,D-peptidoglycan transpeptidase YkuD (ErfK/YbiS/YcfS/YnhG family) [Azospirillum soli]
MEITVHPCGQLIWPGGSFRCALGRGGVRADKREGDGATPVGRFALRRVLWRADRLERPETGLPVSPIAPDDGWCDAPEDPAYNRPVKRPYPASHEELWREDHVYDVIVVMGHNDDPVVPGQGSAVFMHVARPDWEPTAGCIALPLPDLLRLLKDCGPDTALTVLDPNEAQT